MNLTIIVTSLVSCLTGIVGALLPAYIKLQATKDKVVQDERARSDRLLAEQKETIEKEHEKEIALIIQNYEFEIELAVIKSGLNREELKKTTKRTTKNLSEGRIKSIRKSFSNSDLNVEDLKLNERN